MMSAPSKSVTKSIIRSMEMNGALDGHGPNKADVPKVNANEIKERDDGGEDDDDDGEDEDDSDDDGDEGKEESEQPKKGNKAWKKKKIQ